MLEDKIQENIKSALLEKNKKTLDTLRFLSSQIKNKEIEKSSPLNDDEIISIIKKQIKELEGAKDLFEKAGRSELVDDNTQQIEILGNYLPEEMSDDELTQKIQELVSSHKEEYEKNPKSIMGIVISQLKSQADPQRILILLKTLVQI